jgi:hypothetical protein
MEVGQLAAIVLDEEEHADDPITNGLDHEEIGSPDPSELVRQERTPGLAAARCWPSPAIATDRSFADDDAQLEELSTDALTAPDGVVLRHRGDEVANLGAQVRPPKWGPPSPRPVGPPTLAVPREDPPGGKWPRAERRHEEVRARRRIQERLAGVAAAG